MQVLGLRDRVKVLRIEWGLFNRRIPVFHFPTKQLYRDNGKENGDYYNGVTLGIYRDNGK